MTTVEMEAAAVRAVWSELGLPGIVDVHTHFMPKRVMDKVWQYFDAVGPLVGREWPIEYRLEESERVETLRRFGVRRFTSLLYPHKPDMAAWLNQWAREFARTTPDCLPTATFYPEPDAPGYVRRAIDDGVQVFKVHVQVGAFEPNDALLEPVWGLIEEAGIPVVIHCGSGPTPGEFTGPEPIRRLLRRHPGLRLIVAHMGMPEYGEFLDIAERYEQVRLDTTMVFTGFAEETMPYPADQMARLPAFGGRILFGSDFPNIPYPYLEAIRVLTELPGIDDDWLRNVLYRNAADLFSVDGE
jgi:predicted TIM-barrel fold metal-dependent hydrolase